MITHMETIDIYRIESPTTGDGPWMTGSASEIMLNYELQHYTDESHPFLFTDIGYAKPSDMPFCYVTGCDSLAKLRHWFNHKYIVIKLAARGFILRKYTVPVDDVKFGKSERQVGFATLDAVNVEDMDIRTLLTILRDTVI